MLDICKKTENKTSATLPKLYVRAMTATVNMHVQYPLKKVQFVQKSNFGWLQWIDPFWIRSYLGIVSLTLYKKNTAICQINSCPSCPHCHRGLWKETCLPEEPKAGWSISFFPPTRVRKTPVKCRWLLHSICLCVAFTLSRKPLCQTAQGVSKMLLRDLFPSSLCRRSATHERPIKDISQIATGTAH